MKYLTPLSLLLPQLLQSNSLISSDLIFMIIMLGCILEVVPECDLYNSRLIYLQLKNILTINTVIYIQMYVLLWELPIICYKSKIHGLIKDFSGFWMQWAGEPIMFGYMNVSVTISTSFE